MSVSRSKGLTLELISFFSSPVLSQSKSNKLLESAGKVLSCFSLLVILFLRNFQGFFDFTTSCDMLHIVIKLVTAKLV